MIACRFKRQAGAYWLRCELSFQFSMCMHGHRLFTALMLLCRSFDPWWTKTADPMTRHFLPDGTLLGVPSHEPYWMPDAECRCAP